MLRVITLLRCNCVSPLPPLCNNYNVTKLFAARTLLSMCVIFFLTMRNKQVQLYASEDVLTDFYNALANNDSRAMQKVHIPKSDVFYVREAIYARTGEWYSLDHVERAMYLEGHLQRHEVLDPDRERQYG